MRKQLFAIAISLSVLSAEVKFSFSANAEELEDTFKLTTFEVQREEAERLLKQRQLDRVAVEKSTPPHPPRSRLT